MAENSAIEWTHHTFNGWRGCSKVHAGCTNCYAEVNYSVKMHGVKWGPDGTRVKLSDAGWKEPLKWNRDAQAAGERRRVFCASLADVFEDWQGPILNHNGCRMLACRDCGRMGSDGFTEVCPQCGRRDFQWLTMDDLRRDLFALIDETPWLDWLLLTKRPENVLRCWNDVDYRPAGAVQKYRSNVWIGTSISDQHTAIVWLDRLRKNRQLVPVLFVSAEPLIGEIRFCDCFLCDNCTPDNTCRNCGRPVLFPGFVDWMIIGGESGPKAREVDIGWIRSIANRCIANKVPVFIKQLGSKPYQMDCMGDPDVPGGLQHFASPLLLKHDKGGAMAEWPEDLRIRQFPELAKV